MLQYDVGDIRECDSARDMHYVNHNTHDDVRLGKRKRLSAGVKYTRGIHLRFMGGCGFQKNHEFFVYAFDEASGEIVEMSSPTSYHSQSRGDRWRNIIEGFGIRDSL